MGPHGRKVWDLSVVSHLLGISRLVVRSALVLSLAVPSSADYNIKVSSQSVLGPGHRVKGSHKHPMRAMGRRMKGVLQSASPNPRVQGPASQAMPPRPPEVPPLPPPEPPTPAATGAERFFAGAAKVMTKSWRGNIFVWLPAISTDPNTGPTYGLMPVLVLADQTTHHIKHLVAPSFTHNSLFGVTGTLRYYWYPTDASQLYANGSFSRRANRELKLRYENTSALDGVMYLRAEAYHNVDASLRFYGFGSGTHEGDETGYTGKSAVGRVSAGVNFRNAWRATLGARFSRFATAENIIPNTTDLADRFPSVQGIGTNSTVSNEFRLLWDTRDSPVTPSRGSSGELYTEKTSKALGSDSDYVRYGLEGKRFFLWRNPKQVTVLRALYEQTNGRFIPFYERPWIGGRTTLRGFGDGRFIDRGRLVGNIEQRIIFASVKLMGIETNFEVAPFFDLGTVFPTLPKVKRKDFYPVYGGAFRAAVKPNVVGDVEVGVGKEGVAVFVDINYPF